MMMKVRRSERGAALIFSMVALMVLAALSVAWLSTASARVKVADLGLQDAEVPEDRVVFVVEGSFSGPYYVLVSGLKKPPKVRINGAEAPLTEPHQYLPTGNLILKVKGVPRIEIVP